MVPAKTSCRPVRLNVAGRNGHSPGEEAALTARTPSKHYTTDTNSHPTEGGSRIKTLFIISEPSLFVCAVFFPNNTIQSHSLLQPRGTSDYLCSSRKKPHTITMPQVSLRRACQSDRGVHVRYQQLRQTASRRALSADARARSGKAKNHHVGVMTALAIPGQPLRRERGPG